MEWAGGRNGAINGPTVDFRSFFSGRGVDDEFRLARRTRPTWSQLFGLQFDHPSGFAGQAPFPGPLRRRPPAGPTSRVATARRRRCGCECWTVRQVDKYGLTPTSTTAPTTSRTNYDRVLFARNKDGVQQGGGPAQGPVGRRQGQDRRRRAGRQDRRVSWSRSRTLTEDLSKVRLFHTSVTRANATWPSMARRGRIHRCLRRVRRAEVPDVDRPPTSPSWRPAWSARRPTSSRACTGRRRTSRCSTLPDQDLQARPRAGRLPGHRRDPAPVPRPGLAELPNGGRQPRLRRRPGERDARRSGRGSGRRSSAARTRAPTRPCALAQDLLGSRDVTTFVGPITVSPRSSWPSTPARCWSTSACCPSRRHPTAAPPPARPSARPRPAGPVARCRST